MLTFKNIIKATFNGDSRLAVKKTAGLFAVLILASAAIMLAATPAFAAFTEQFAITTKAISLANTCTANPPGVLSIHYNPAGLSKLPEGNVFSQGLTIPWLVKTSKFTADKDFEGFFHQWGPQEGETPDPVAGTKDSNSSGALYVPILNKTVNFLVGPSSGLSTRQPGSRWTFAIANYAPFAGGLNYKSGSPVSWGGRTLFQQHLIYAAPGASYQLTPTLALGVSVGIGQTAMGIRMKMRTPNELVALTRVLGDATKDLEIPIVSELTLPPPWFGGGLGPYDKAATVDIRVRDDFSPNYNLGFLWEPKKWLTIGGVYQSEIKVQAKGRYTFKYTEQFQRMMNWQGSSPLLLIVSAMLDLPNRGVPFQSGTAYTEFKYPRRIQTGVMVRPLKRLTVELDVSYANWSVVQQDNFVLDQDIQAFRLVKLLGYTYGNRNMVVVRKLKDTTHLGISFEYQLNNKLTLRCGYEHRPTSVPKKYFDQLYFVPDLDFYAIGAGVSLPHQTTLDLALGLLYNPSYKIPDNTSLNFNSTDFWHPVYNPYAGIDYEQKTAIYMASINLTMPFTAFIEMQKEMMAKQQEAIHHIVSLLNPFD